MPGKPSDNASSSNAMSLSHNTSQQQITNDVNLLEKDNFPSFSSQKTEESVTNEPLPSSSSDNTIKVTNNFDFNLNAAAYQMN